MAIDFINSPATHAPLPGSTKALAAVAPPQVQAVLGCNQESETCLNSQVEHAVPEKQAAAEHFALTYSDMQYSSSLESTHPDMQLGSARSVLMRDMPAKRDLGIHAVPHIELWRDAGSGAVGVDLIASSLSSAWVLGVLSIKSRNPAYLKQKHQNTRHNKHRKKNKASVRRGLSLCWVLSCSWEVDCRLNRGNRQNSQNQSRKRKRKRGPCLTQNPGNQVPMAPVAIGHAQTGCLREMGRTGAWAMFLDQFTR